MQPKLQENVGIKGKRVQVFETGGDRKIVSGTSVVQDINDKSENRLQLIVRNGLTTRSNAQLFGQSTEKV